MSDFWEWMKDKSFTILINGDLVNIEAKYFSEQMLIGYKMEYIRDNFKCLCGCGRKAAHEIFIEDPGTQLKEIIERYDNE